MVTVRISESRISIPTITLATALSHGGFVHGPSTSRSLQSMSRNSVVIGSTIPHSACTASVITPSGAPGMSTIPAAATIKR